MTLYQIKTAYPRSGPVDYINKKFVLFDEYEKWEKKDGTPITGVATVVEAEDLQELYDNIDFESIIVKPPGGYDHPDVELVAVVYDGYYE